MFSSERFTGERKPSPMWPLRERGESLDRLDKASAIDRLGQKPIAAVVGADGLIRRQGIRGQRHDLRQKNMNGTTPPREVDSDALLRKHVARHDGGFGVVKLENAKADGVRILFEFRDPPE
ncbi:MAG: hypothetical protein ABIP94_02165 [Planctomycetota bacterium]